VDVLGIVYYGVWDYVKGIELEVLTLIAIQDATLILRAKQ
jgi:hypothetical protein